MQRMKSGFAMVIVSLFAVGALTFGAGEVFAANAATTCIYNPPHELGECSSEGECDTWCAFYNGEGDCSTGCCGCMLR